MFHTLGFDSSHAVFFSIEAVIGDGNQNQGKEGGGEKPEYERPGKA